MPRHRKKLSKGLKALVLSEEKACRLCGYPTAVSDILVQRFQRRMRRWASWFPDSWQWMYRKTIDEDVRAAFDKFSTDQFWGIRLEIDHIVPVALGGSNRRDNLQVLCEFCNGYKGARMPASA